MTVLRRLAVLACAVAIAGCAEKQTHENAESTGQLNASAALQISADQSSDAADPVAMARQAEGTESNRSNVSQASNPVVIDTSTLAAIPQRSQNESEESSEQTPSKSSGSEQSTFNDRMTAAHRAIEQEHWGEATRLLASALQLNPSSAAVRDLQNFVTLQQELLNQQVLTQRFTNALHVEQWSEAHEIAKNIKTEDSDTLAQIQRSKTLIEAEQLADQLLAEPNRLSRPSVQSDVKRLKNLTENVNPGNRVGEKLSHLNELSRLWTTPVMVNLSSDGKTTVIVRPGRSLGRFRSQKIQLMPGEYVLIGRRDGFREVRRTLRLDPNDDPKTIGIAAKERF